MSVFVQTSRDDPTTKMDILRDYKLHSSSSASAAAQSKQEQKTDVIAREKLERERLSKVENPENWLSGYRRIPKYRPINKYIDTSTRTAGDGSTGLYIFINGLIAGVTGVSYAARAWTWTAGKVAPKLFQYEVGGEW